MSENLITSLVTVLLAIIGVALIAVLVSRQANTSGVIAAGSNAFSTGLGRAISPITGTGLFAGGSGGFTGGGGFGVSFG